MQSMQHADENVCTNKAHHLPLIPHLMPTLGGTHSQEAGKENVYRRRVDELLFANLNFTFFKMTVLHVYFL